MPLLDPKHIVAPFYRTTHLVAIIALVLLFTVYRLATGKIEIENTTASMRSITQPGKSDRPTSKLLPPLLGSDSESGSNDSSSTESSSTKTIAVPSNAQDLNDIERVLGLEKK